MEMCSRGGKLHSGSEAGGADLHGSGKRQQESCTSRPGLERLYNRSHSYLKLWSQREQRLRAKPHRATLACVLDNLRSAVMPPKYHA